MWARLLSSTNQPSFLCQKVVDKAKMEQSSSEFQYLKEEDSNGRYVESLNDIQNGENWSLE